MIDVVLYIHILAATAWIGGALLLFLLGVFIKDIEAQQQTYEHLGPFYGYFESFWLTILLITGGTMFYHFNLIDVLTLDVNESRLGYMMSHKLFYVGTITFLTIIHMSIALKTHKKERSKLQKIISRGSSLMIFFLNLGILWFAMQLRYILS
ncbi:MAG: hypothetical protein L3J19_03190 [Sulfurimonas sp.]|nr:hypothetical protein [Sulfurimonas sp.]